MTNKEAKEIEQTIPITYPIEPTNPITNDAFNDIVRNKINELIIVVNLLRIEVLKIKEK